METMRAWSFSRLETFEKCPYQAFLKFVEKRPEPDTRDRGPLDRGTAIHTSAEDFIQGVREDIAHELRHFDTELQELREEFLKGNVLVEDDWAYDVEWTPCDWWGETAWLRMKLDVRQQLDSNQVKIIDWKSGKKDGNEVKHSQQGMLYAIGEFLRYPETAHVRVEFAYTDKNDRMKKDYTRERALRFLPTWHERALKATSTTDFQAKPNKINCRWCPYSPNNGGDASCPWGVEV